MVTLSRAGNGSSRRASAAGLRAFRGAVFGSLFALAFGLTITGFRNQLAAAITSPDQSNLSLQQIEDFRVHGIPDDQWTALLQTMGSEDQRASVRSLIKDQQPFPARRLVTLLSSPLLAVRLGALDLLEDAAGDTFGFDPWLEDPGVAGNAAALTRWKTWSEKGKDSAAQPASLLNEETFRAIADEIMSSDRDRSERAMRRMDGFGLASVAHLEAFLKDHPSIEAAPRAALKTAEYRAVLLHAIPKQAAALARDLAFGRPEAQSAALAALSKSEPAVLPVIADFLASDDALVRESAVDAAFGSGKEHAVGIIVERLKSEKAESVLHAMLRGLGEYAKDPKSVAAISGFLEHPSENVVISALEALGAHGVNEDDDGAVTINDAGTPGAMDTGGLANKLAPRLADPRWRVRAAALETIAKRGLASLAPQVSKRLQDSDLFVRVSAVHALVAVAPGDANRQLIEQFIRQDDLKAPILAAFFSENNNPPPAEVWPALEKAPPEIILQCLDMLEDRGDYEGKRIPYAAPLATHPNQDVSASALRLLAGRGIRTGLLLDALKSSDPVRQDAVLDQLHLHPGFLAESGTSKASSLPPAPAIPNPVLDELYNALVGSAKKERAKPGADHGSEASPAEMLEVLKRFFEQGSPQRRFRAAVVLLGQGDAEAAKFLLARFDTLSSLDRRAVVGTLGNVAPWQPGPILELATRTLRDPADDVREQAVELWLETKTPDRLAGILAEFSRPGSLLQADDLYGWEMDRLATTASVRETIQDWSREVLADASAPDSRKVLAMVLLGRSKQTKDASIDPLLNAPSPWLRRAAYRALGKDAAESRIDALLSDDSAMVRAALPFLASPNNQGWSHWFDDAHHVQDDEDFDRNPYRQSFGGWAQGAAGKSTASPAMIAALEKLTRDPSDLVRFEAQFALLRLGHPVDPTTLSELIASQGEDSNARGRISRFLTSNFSRLGKGYSVLTPFLTEIDANQQSKILAHFGVDKETSPTTFAALAQLSPQPVHANDLAIAPESQAPPLTTPFRVLFFFKTGCKECERARALLRRHAPDFPTMTLEERNIDDNRDAVLDEMLSSRFRLRDTLHQVTPAIFTQAGALVGENITFPVLGDLLRRSNSLIPEPNWARITPIEVSAAKQTITTRYDTMSLGVISAAGLLDGANPCAFATIVFMLSYLKIARRTPREILAVGAAFIGAVFLSSFLVGLGLSQVLSKVIGLRFAGMLLTYGLAAFALVVAVLSFRDAQLAVRGQYGEMTLQLPGVFKERIRSVIRVGARASRFVIAAFIAGVLISFLELACTGQVYLPTILYMLRSGHASAVGYLVFYNLAFVTPLVVVFILTWAGVRNETLIRFQKEHTALVKVLTGVLFLALTAFLLFGHLVLPALRFGQ